VQKIVQLFVVVIVVAPTAMFGQSYGAFVDYSHPHYAELIRLGGPYVAVGRGLSCMHSNSAALGFHTGTQVQFSRGRSMQTFMKEYIEAYDAGAAVHFANLESTLGVEFNDDEYYVKDLSNRPSKYHFTDRRIGFHFARVVSDVLALGVTLRRYESSVRQLLYPGEQQGKAKAAFWDLSFSAHARAAADFLGRPMDEIRLGLTLDNIIGTEVYYIDEAQGDPMHQVIRAGTAYFWRPGMGRLLACDLLSALVTFEASVQGTRQDFRNWGTLGAGVELRLMEVLLLSVGRENFMELSDKYHYWSRYPVLRWGAGLDLPLHRLFGLADPVTLQLDYAVTEWRDDAGTSNPNLPDHYKLLSNAASAQLRVGMR